MTQKIGRELLAIGKMTVSELREKYAALFGEESASRNRDYLRKRVGYRIQELAMGGLTAQQIKMAKVLLWKGHCSVHQMFQAQHVLRWRQQNPSGMVISHPECNFEVCKLSDYVGSTDFIIKNKRAAGRPQDIADVKARVCHV